MDELETPVCLSQYFVNKQNVRSFDNVLKCNIWKNASSTHLGAMLPNSDLLVSEIPADFLYILSSLWTNLMNKRKDDFRQYFLKNQVATCLTPVSKEFVFTNTWQALSEIIPRDFFGCNHNSKIFKKCCKTIVYSMKRQHFTPAKLIKGWDVSVIPWTCLLNSRKILYCLIQWIIKYILAPIICLNFYVTTCKLDADENKLYFFWKSQWQSFYDKQISKMVYTKVIKKVQSYSLGKRVKYNYGHDDRLKLKLFKKEIPKLNLTLKPNNDCRPIVCYKNNSLVTSKKYKIKERLRFLKTLAGKPVQKIEDLHKTLYKKWIGANKPKLYFIKSDLSNAFGSINREKLSKILSERYMKLLQTETCVIKKKKITRQFQDIVTELCKPILFRAGSTVYEWKGGLVQGYKYSSALSELYYHYMDELYLFDYINNTEFQMRLYARVVDDYLFITDSLDDAFLFLKSLFNYRNINYDKTVVNFPHDNIKFQEEITFLGYLYNTTSMEVSRASNIYTGQMCYKIAFTSGYSDISKFIESRIGQSGIQISSHIFNLQYNSEALIWRHIFTTYCLSANKICTILAILCEEDDMSDLLQIYKKRVTVKLTTAMLDTLIRNKSDDFIFVYCINHFRYLSWKALYLCAKLTPKCSGIIPKVAIELCKSNCIFGAWRPHASRIDGNGNIQRKALKHVCRRIDLRQMFRSFEVLPPGFECYHHKRLV